MWNYNYTYSYPNELYHYGVLGMKWGVRRYQNPDGSLTSKGKKRIRTKKILQIAAGVTVAVCAAYYANKIYKNRVDQIIKAGTMMQRIEGQETGSELHDMFYASIGKHDNQRYYRLFGREKQLKTGKAFILNLNNNKDIKVASIKNATQTFEELYKNDSLFRKEASRYVKWNGLMRNQANLNDLSPKNIKKMYENFNVNLIDIRDEGSGIDKIFFNNLKNKGYGAVQDINDMKYSGYNAKNPLIFFDNANKNITVSNAKQITENLRSKRYKESRKATLEQLMKYGNPPALAIALTTGVTINTRPNKRKK